jgi:hypothetical protein
MSHAVMAKIQEHVSTGHLEQKIPNKAGLWSQYTKPLTLTLTPQFLNLRLLHKNSICTNNGKPTKMVNGIIRHLITTT